MPPGSESPDLCLTVPLASFLLACLALAFETFCVCPCESKAAFSPRVACAQLPWGHPVLWSNAEPASWGPGVRVCVFHGAPGLSSGCPKFESSRAAVMCPVPATVPEFNLPNASYPERAGM